MPKSFLSSDEKQYEWASVHLTYQQGCLALHSSATVLWLLTWVSPEALRVCGPPSQKCL